MISLSWAIPGVLLFHGVEGWEWSDLAAAVTQGNAMIAGATLPVVAAIHLTNAPLSAGFSLEIDRLFDLRVSGLVAWGDSIQDWFALWAMQSLITLPYPMYRINQSSQLILSACRLLTSLALTPVSIHPRALPPFLDLPAALS